MEQNQENLSSQDVGTTSGGQEMSTGPPAPPPPPPQEGLTKVESGKRKKNWTVDDAELDKQKKSLNRKIDFVGISSKSYNKNDTGFVGLSNQGATCYLNSLIQTLFMTPEVRIMIYKWVYNTEIHGDEESCIPLQLQKLFGKLQLSKNRAISTTDLTQSFGWTRQQSFIQHDVQELCRVLFDALDKTLQPEIYQQRNQKNDQNDNSYMNFIENFSDLSSCLVSDLYSGKMIDYLHAKGEQKPDGTPYGRTREELYMDLQLVIRDVGSIEEALDNYVKPEALEDDNQWFCEELNKKVDAVKGLKFKTLPYLLTLHLKRFDYDLVTWQRIKLPNKVSFPFELDMKKYIENPKRNEYKYELFSVLIHSGSARGGHYYAYVKSLKTKKWYNFNDSNVSEIKEKDVEEMFGEDVQVSNNGKSWGSSTNAYMLMYRLIEPKMNIDEISMDTVPHFIKESVEKENEEYEKERKEWEEKRSKIAIRIWYADQPPLSIQLNRSMTLSEAEKNIFEAFQKRKEWGNHPFQCVRIREYNSVTKQPSRLFTGKEDFTLDDLNFSPMKSYYLETKEIGKDWQIVKDQMLVYVIKFNPDIQDFETVFTTRIDSDLTMKGLKKVFEEKFGAEKFPAERINIIMMKNITEFVQFSSDDDEKLIDKELNIKENSLLYVESLTEPGATSICVQKLEEQQNQYDIYFNHPANKGDNDFTQHISFDKRKTIKDLKEAIAEELKIDVNKFRLCDKRLKLPIRNENQTLLESELFDNATLFLEYGSPLKENEYLIKVYLHNQPSDEDNHTEEPQINVENKTAESTAATATTATEAIAAATAATASRVSTKTALSEFYKKRKEYKLLSRLIVANDSKLIDLKMRIAKILKIESTDMIRLRGKFGLALQSPLLEHEKTMKEIFPDFSDQTQIAVQKLNKKEQLSPGDRLYYIQRWYPSIWKFGERRELIINTSNKKGSQDLKELIANSLQEIPENSSDNQKESVIEVSDIQFAKAPLTFDYWIEKECADIALLNWTCETENVFDRPFQLKEGDIIFYKDKKENEKIEIEELKRIVASDSGKVTYHGASKEHELKIYTIYDEKPNNKKQKSVEDTKNDNEIASDVPKEKVDIENSTTAP